MYLPQNRIRKKILKWNKRIRRIASTYVLLFYTGFQIVLPAYYTSLDIPFSNFFDDVVRKEKLLRPYSNEEYESNLREVVREKFEENSRTLQNTRNQGQDARQR